ncbi:hypothetical protein NDU88_003716 [Pleurodeles waltl]|uniref:Uncharacterized protein n=1 Tax=Pleurodeles waltl TaxID=8319 RepID=A0AAV7T5W1_PLEWA|nr:hypothetical protein NDU88_003716 [Pleurodeles waltl]
MMRTCWVKEKEEDELEGQPRSRRSVAFTGTATCGQYKGGEKWECYTGKRESGDKKERGGTSEMRQKRKPKDATAVRYVKIVVLMEQLAQEVELLFCGNDIVYSDLCHNRSIAQI